MRPAEVLPEGAPTTPGRLQTPGVVPTAATVPVTGPPVAAIPVVVVGGEGVGPAGYRAEGVGAGTGAGEVARGAGEMGRVSVCVGCVCVGGGGVGMLCCDALHPATTRQRVRERGPLCQSSPSMHTPASQPASHPPTHHHNMPAGHGPCHGAGGGCCRCHGAPGSGERRWDG
jgi:hypothetical protein